MDWNIVIPLIVSLIIFILTNKNSRDIEILKSELNVNVLKKREYQQRIFLIYTDLWKNIQTTLDIFLVYTQPLQEYPDLEHMTIGEVEDFLNDSDLSKSHKTIILKSSNKNKEYQRIIFWYRLSILKKSYNDLYSSFVINKIFFSEDLKKNLDSLIILFHKALINIETGWETRDFHEKDMGYKLIREAYTSIDKEAKHIIDKIENLIEKDLR